MKPEIREGLFALSLLLAMATVALLVVAIWASDYLTATKLLLTGGVIGLCASGLFGVAWRQEGPR